MKGQTDRSRGAEGTDKRAQEEALRKTAAGGKRGEEAREGREESVDSEKEKGRSKDGEETDGHQTERREDSEGRRRGRGPSERGRMEMSGKRWTDGLSDRRGRKDGQA